MAIRQKKSSLKKFYHLKGGEENGTWYLGRVRIFIVNKFIHQEELNIDYDVKLDIKAIKTSFTNLNFKVDEAILNPTAAELIAHLKEEIDYFGCVILFIFSHGEENAFYASDYDKNEQKGIVNAFNDVYDQFSSDKWSMQHCPKVFFNEWCQIAKDMPKKRDLVWKGKLKIDELEIDGLGKKIFHDAESDSDSDSDDSDKDTPKCRSASFRSTAHRLIYNAAQPMYRVPVGSHSTQTFCRLLNEHGQKKDLQQILKSVIKQVGRTEVGSGTHDYPQPSYTSTLINGKLYLLPVSKVYQLKSTYRNKFEHVSTLGEGKFGVVFQARHLKEDVMYAVKRIRLLDNTDAEQNRIKREIDFLARSNCKYIVRYYCSWDEWAEFDCQKKENQDWKIEDIKNTHSEIARFFFIQMELCRETLEVYLKNNSLRDTIESLNIFKQIVQGLSFLHAQNKVHRDIKPANILFALTNKDSDFSVRIADFGLAREVGNFSTMQVAGSLQYMAPEVELNTCDTKWDMFSAGLILVELLYNCSGKNHDFILLAAKHNNFPDKFHDELKFALPVLEKLLSYKSSVRPTSDELLETLRTWNEEPTQNEKQFEVSLPSASRKNTEDHNTSDQEEVHFKSTCTLEGHEVPEVGRWSTVDTLLWTGEDYSIYFPLSADVASNTQWEVHFERDSNDYVVLFIHCVSLRVQFRAVSVRLFAVVEDHSHLWMEVASVLNSGEQWCGRFSKKMSDFPNIRPLRVRVRVQWTELDQLPSAPDMWKDGAAHIRCRWQLNDWKTVCPTSDEWCFFSEVEWRLFSQTFGQKGALWRIVLGKLSSLNNRQLVVHVELQHLPTSVNWSGVSWNCSLSLWDRNFDKQKKDMEQSSWCVWRVVDDVESELENPLDLSVVIHVSRKN